MYSSFFEGPKTYTYDVAARLAKECVAGSKTSFGAGMSILPRDRREGMYALYAFCRTVDDIADDGATEETRRRDLDLWRDRIRDLFQKNEPSDFITTALLPALKKFDLIEEDFQTIIDGMEMDARDEPIFAPSLRDLDLYCDKVASAVGRISVRIFGENSQNGTQLAFHLGRALQLTNILRDVAEDATRGRLYLPQELLDKHGISIRDDKGQKNADAILRHPKLADVCRDLAAHAREHYAVANKMMALCPEKNIKPARIMRIYYGAIFNKLVAEDWRDPFHRVGLSKLQKIVLILRALLGAKQP